MSDTGSDYCPACRKDVVYVDDGGDQVCSICGMTKIAAEYAHATEKKVTRRKRWLKAFWIGLGALSVLGFIVIEALRPERAQRLTGHMIGFIAILTAMYLIGGLVYLISRLIRAWRNRWRPLRTRMSRAAEYAHATEKKVTRRKRWSETFWIGLGVYFWIGLGALGILGFIAPRWRLEGDTVALFLILTAMYLIGGLVYLIFRLILAWRDGWRPLLTRRSRAIAVAWIVWVPIAWSYWNNKIAHHYDDLWEYFLWFILIFGPLLAIPVIRWVARGAPARE